MKENKYIEIIKNTLGELSSYIGDDTAYIPEKDLILTQDTLIEDVHFRLSTISPYDLGIKSIAVNLSDIAASGGVAKFVLISLSLPKSLGEDFVENFYRGVNDICRKYGVIVAGGDLTGAEKVNISVSAIGFGSGVVPLKRSNARIGDLVVVTGHFGSSGFGLYCLEHGLKSEEYKKFIQAHVNPVPQLETGRQIATFAPKSALMDASDGLADALYKISAMSNVRMEIEGDKIPIDEDLIRLCQKHNLNPYKLALFGGEDYELVGTVTTANFKRLIENNVPVKVIGNVVKKDKVPCVEVRIQDKILIIDEKTLDKEVFDHFE